MENPACSMSIDTKFDQCSSSSTAVVCDKGREQVTFDYSHFEDKHRRNNMLNKHRWMLPYCTIAAVLIACGALLGLVAVYVELCRANSILETNRELIHAQDIKILNQTHSMDTFRRQLRNVQGGPGSGRGMASPGAGIGPSSAAKVPEELEPPADAAAATSTPGTVYFRWGVSDCPNTASLVYAGVAASGSSLSIAKGGGSNILCMTSQPEYDVVSPGREDTRGRIYSLEYRNGRTFGDQSELHGHDVPCAACLTGSGRRALLMVPGRASCPDNWTREYRGILMSSRTNNVRTSYVCVDAEAESRPGTMTEDSNSSLLFPVEGVCGTGGGLPCGPYVDGNELQCAVCSM